ncbi:hypothetical protein WN55_03820 [Dufourea novaeangliae]|uniref:Uncharacterized protein n=1 Tax=Dufourea novaeangliae TaxID=178035 RepID=A0A154NWF9_DUFNO|nr:hypothetical protein WN55_03820 [Dufourea novaeangliae]
MPVAVTIGANSSSLPAYYRSGNDEYALVFGGLQERYLGLRKIRNTFYIWCLYYYLWFLF